MCTRYLQFLDERRPASLSEIDLRVHDDTLYFFKANPEEEKERDRVLVLCQRQSSTDNDALTVDMTVRSLEQLIRERIPNAAIECMTNGFMGSPNFEADYKFKLTVDPTSNPRYLAQSQEFFANADHGLKNSHTKRTRISKVVGTFFAFFGVEIFR